MYREYFGLKELPFSIAPDPRYLYMSDQHREALAHLVYGINSEGGFVLLTGEVGTGKTTVCRCLLEQIAEDTNIAFVFNPRLTVEELLSTICDELSIHYPEGNTSIKVFVDHINAYLLDAHAKDRKTVLIIEEAQNLNTDLLEQVRLLTNLETNKHKLLQIIMLGQPELKNMLSQPELRQIAQRITARYHLGPLSKKEVAAYVNHRLSVAGARSRLFLDSTFGKLYRLSRGIPRLINLICDRALLGAYVQGKDRVDKSTLVKAAREVFGGPEFQKHRKLFRWVLASLALIGCMAALAAIYYNYQTQPLAVVASPPVQQASVTKPIAEVPGLLRLNRPADKPIYRGKEMAYQSRIDKQLTLITTKDISLLELIKSSGYDLDDKDIGLFLRDFISLNRNIKRLSVIPKGTTVMLPLKNLKARGQKITLYRKVEKVGARKGPILEYQPVEKTLIHLNSAVGTGDPVLIDRKKGK